MLGRHREAKGGFLLRWNEQMEEGPGACTLLAQKPSFSWHSFSQPLPANALAHPGCCCFYLRGMLPNIILSIVGPSLWALGSWNKAWCLSFRIWVDSVVYSGALCAGTAVSAKRCSLGAKFRIVSMSHSFKMLEWI